MPHTENENAPGILFDLDGTLADTLDDITSAVNAALDSRNLPPQPIERIRDWVGDGVSHLLARASGNGDEGTVNALVAAFRKRYDQNCLDRTRLYAGMGDVLTALQELGCPMCVLSNKPHEYTRRIGRALLPRWRFMAYVGPSETVPPKPNPAGAIMLAEKMRRSPDRVIVIGDGEADIRTAKAAGMHSIAVTWGFREEHALQEYEPDAIVTQPNQLPDAVRRLSSEAQ